MALSLQQQQDIIYYLGWPGKTLLVASTHYNSVIASRVVSLIPEIESRAIKLLTRIENIDRILEQALSRMSTLEVTDIKLDPNEAARLRRERRIIINELSDLLDIEVMKSSGSNISVVS